MDPRTFRADTEASYAKRKSRRGASSASQQTGGVRELVATLRDTSAKLSHRQAAVRELGARNPVKTPSAMNALIKVLGDNNDNASLRDGATKAGAWLRNFHGLTSDAPQIFDPQELLSQLETLCLNCRGEGLDDDAIQMILTGAKNLLGLQ